jgi:hypothetical protein
MRYPLAIVLLACLGLVAGCATGPRPVPAPNANRLNPPGLMTMEQVAHAINGNNDRIPSLWATLNYSATIHDNGQVHSVSSDMGALMYRRPAGFRLVGQKELVGTVFDLGSNGREYWMEVVPGTNRLWWGRYADLATLNSDRLPIPIRPDLVMEVLPVAPINLNFNEQPVPTMRYDNAADQYVFDFDVKAPDRWVVEKEIAYDRTTLRPRRVTLYDANGRPVLKASLGMDVRVQMLLPRFRQRDGIQPSRREAGAAQGSGGVPERGQLPGAGRVGDRCSVHSDWRRRCIDSLLSWACCCCWRLPLPPARRT